MEKKLKFLKSWGVFAFVSENATGTLSVLKTEKEGAKAFFRTESGLSGKVALDFDPDSKEGNVMVSLVEADDLDEPFYLLHREGKVVVLATFG